MDVVYTEKDSNSIPGGRGVCAYLNDLNLSIFKSLILIAIYYLAELNIDRESTDACCLLNKKHFFIGQLKDLGNNSQFCL